MVLEVIVLGEIMRENREGAPGLSVCLLGGRSRKEDGGGGRKTRSVGTEKLKVLLQNITVLVL